MAETALSVLSSYFPEKSVKLEELCSEYVIIRCNFRNIDEAEEFKEAYSKESKTDWIVYHNSGLDNKRIVVHKIWKCKHSSLNKSSSGIRNANCKACIDILVKKDNKNTRKNDVFLKHSPALTAKIKIHWAHSHSTIAADYLRLRRISEKTKDEFYGYFNEGLTVSEARSFHESKLLVEDNCYELLADAAVNPTSRQVHYLHDLWRAQNFGPAADPITKLLEKIPIYKEEGAEVHVNEGCTLVVTKIHKRNQLLETSAEVIFVDSTSNCDTMQTTVTVLLSATSAGAVPICVLLHSGQSHEAYKKAFNIIKENYPNCFGGKAAPSAFITDDSAAEKRALQDIWPTAKQLLCQFHVLQAEWRWLCSSQSGISSENRQHCMKRFQKVMYAKDNAELETAVDDILNLSEEKKFSDRFKAFYERKEEWVSYFRSHLVTRGNNTNNYAEITIRILKDIILCRTKAFNIVALVDFCVTTWEKYFVKKIMHHATNRNQTNAITFRKLCSKMEGCSEKDIEQVGPNMFLVPSQRLNEKYCINTLIGTCTCTFGAQGAFCKHMAFLTQHHKTELVNAPPISCLQRYRLGQLALGDKCPDISFFCDYKRCTNGRCSYVTQQDCQSASETEANDVAAQVHDTSENAAQVSSSSFLPPVENPETMDLQEAIDFESNSEGQEKLLNIKMKIKDELHRITQLADLTNIGALEKTLLELKKIRNSSQLNMACFNITSVIKKQSRKGGCIKVQPTAISRRKGVTKGSKRLPSGRRPTNAPAKRKKRPHNLNYNVQMNVPNAILHGTGH